MTNTDAISLVIFVFVATFTPGPGNIASASMGMIYGYRKSLRFIAGIVSGYLLIMMLSGFFSGKLITHLPAVEPFLRVSGTMYILWMAYATLRTTYNSADKEQLRLHFRHGFLLQALNPKAIIFGITIFTTFLSGFSDSTLGLTSSTMVLTIVTFCSVSSWAFIGCKIQERINRQGLRRLINIILSALLCCSAITLSGILH